MKSSYIAQYLKIKTITIYCDSNLFWFGYAVLVIYALRQYSVLIRLCSTWYLCIATVICFDSIMQYLELIHCDSNLFWFGYAVLVIYALRQYSILIRLCSTWNLCIATVFCFDSVMQYLKFKNCDSNLFWFGYAVLEIYALRQYSVLIRLCSTWNLCIATVICFDSAMQYLEVLIRLCSTWHFKQDSAQYLAQL